MTFTKRERQSLFGKCKYKARSRGIEWNLTFQEWDDWWGEDISLRGNDLDDLQMCRVGDSGPYELGNIYKATKRQNIDDRNKFGSWGKRVLTDEQVEEIKSSSLSSRKIAEQYGIGKTLAWKIRTGQYRPTDKLRLVETGGVFIDVARYCRLVSFLEPYILLISNSLLETCKEGFKV